MAGNPQSLRIFISYRREDSANVSGRIYDRLAAHFGDAAVFKDVDDIPFGVDFKNHLNGVVAECAIELVVIGPNWLTVTDEDGERRLDDPADFVRIEIEAALDRDIPVVPLLVSGASMPKDHQLPPGMQKLAYRNGTPVRPDPDFHHDMDRLIAGLEPHLAPPTQPVEEAPPPVVAEAPPVEEPPQPVEAAAPPETAEPEAPRPVREPEPAPERKPAPARPAAQAPTRKRPNLLWIGLAGVGVLVLVVGVVLASGGFGPAREPEEPSDVEVTPKDEEPMDEEPMEEEPMVEEVDWNERGVYVAQFMEQELGVVGTVFWIADRSYEADLMLQGFRDKWAALGGEISGVSNYGPSGPVDTNAVVEIISVVGDAGECPDLFFLKSTPPDRSLIFEAKEANCPQTYYIIYGDTFDGGSFEFD